jgi:hypothetical protein
MLQIPCGVLVIAADDDERSAERERGRGAEEVKKTTEKRQMTMLTFRAFTVQVTMTMRGGGFLGLTFSVRWRGVGAPDSIQLRGRGRGNEQDGG